MIRKSKSKKDKNFTFKKVLSNNNICDQNFIQLICFGQINIFLFYNLTKWVNSDEFLSD